LPGSNPNTIFIRYRKLALEGLAAVVNRVTCSVPVSGSTLYVHACHLRGALPPPELAGCSWGVGTSCGARKLARTPHVNQKKKKI